MYDQEPLRYDYDALEPFIDTHTMGLHYNKHYLGYLKRLNEILKKNNYSYQGELKDVIYHLNEFNKEDIDNLLFNLGGVINHELYWNGLSPQGNTKPVKSIKKAIESKYSDFDNFKEKFREAALALKGSGYTFLVIDSNKNIGIINTENQITPYLYNYIPIMNIDMWEHAYYLNYKNNKREYIDNFFDILDWERINDLYEEKIR